MPAGHKWAGTNKLLKPFIKSTNHTTFERIFQWKSSAAFFGLPKLGKGSRGWMKFFSQRGNQAVREFFDEIKRISMKRFKMDRKTPVFPVLLPAS
jgi:hypothetical protein